MSTDPLTALQKYGNSESISDKVKYQTAVPTICCVGYYLDMAICLHPINLLIQN